MSAGDVPRCPTCGVYLYPSNAVQFHVCGNREASYSICDWRSAEIERLTHELAEARELLSLVYASPDLNAKIDAFLAATAPPAGDERCAFSDDGISCGLPANHSGHHIG